MNYKTNMGIIYYGPHECERGCGVTIVKASKEQGGKEYDQPTGPIYPNTKWLEHKCSKKVSKKD